MALEVVYHQLVREELREIYWWYAERSLKTADNFLVVFRAAVTLLAEFPKMHELYRDDIRKASSRPFPYHGRANERLGSRRTDL